MLTAETFLTQANIVYRMTQYEELLSPLEAAEMLNVSTKTLWRWAVIEHRIRYRRFSTGRIRYFRIDIEKMLQGVESTEDESAKQPLDVASKIQQIKDTLHDQKIKRGDIDQLTFQYCEAEEKIVITRKTLLRDSIAKINQVITRLGGKLVENRFEIPYKRKSDLQLQALSQQAPINKQGKTSNPES